jgi:hypothetical protein
VPTRVVGSPGSIFSPICRVSDGPTLDRRTKKWFEYPQHGAAWTDVRGARGFDIKPLTTEAAL